MPDEVVISEREVRLIRPKAAVYIRVDLVVDLMPEG
jgi:hypothetical protein